ATVERVAAARQAALQAPALPAALAAAYQKPVTLEFREAPLRQVFEALARSSAINFVFDKDVRGDARVTVFLRNVSLDEALRVILATQQLDRKLLNDTTVLVYPNTPAKQREHQELVTRSLYLANADVKQALTLVRMMTKTRDVHAEERLNALVVRDTPEVVRQIERLLATIDLPEPEVTLAVEVMEVASDQVQNLGIDWPATVNIGLPSPATVMGLSGDGVRASIANPGFVASLRASTGSTNLLANPTIRVRNREKAKVQIGNKLPVFSSTSTPSNGSTTTTASVGSLAYNLGTRLTTTALRLRDGETQVLAGLINDEDRRTAKGLPGLATAPFVGRLFGVTGDNRSKTEIVMLITPRIVRPLLPPSAAEATLASGTDAMPGSPSLRLRSGGTVAVPLATGAGAPAAVTSTPLPDASAPSDGTGALR
ncbi:MAG: general secretion pathway protein GspD, partial [Burkholderiales bacterium PBB5]